MKRSRHLVLSLIALAALLTGTAHDAEAQSLICGRTDVQPFYAPMFGNYHCYGLQACPNAGVMTTLCSTSQPGCTVENMYVAILQSVSHIGPTPQTIPVQNCGITLLPIMFEPELPTRHPIITTLDVNGRSITNWTLSGHIFHPGKVTRTIARVGSQVVVTTTGEGNGPFGPLNVWFAVNEIWPQVDNELSYAANLWLNPPAGGSGGGGGNGGGIIVPPGFTCTSGGGGIIYCEPSSDY